MAWGFRVVFGKIVILDQKVLVATERDGLTHFYGTIVISTSNTPYKEIRRAYEEHFIQAVKIKNTCNGQT